MKRLVLILAWSMCLLGCTQQHKNTAVLHREFFDTSWERFDYVRNDVEITEETTFDLSMDITFTDDYPFQDFSMVFTVFTADGSPYRSKGYKFNLKDADGNWNCERVGDCYTFVLPINKALRIADKGTYTFQIENRMPITPLLGVKELTLYRN